MHALSGPRPRLIRFALFSPVASHVRRVTLVRVFNLAPTTAEEPGWTPPFLAVLTLPSSTPSGKVLDARLVWPAATVNPVRTLHFLPP